MAGIDSLYRVENGRVLIEIKLSSVHQLFNSFDPAPFYEKELDVNAENYIVDSVKDFPLKTQSMIVIHLPESLIDTKEAQEIPKAIRSHYYYKALSQRRKFRERSIYGQFTLVVGLVFLAIATIASLAIYSYSDSFPVLQLVATALEVTGWAAMWEPVTVFLFQLWPIYKQRKIYEKISEMEIDIRPFVHLPLEGPELVAKLPHFDS